MIQAALIGDALGYSPELIVVAVGASADVNAAEFQRRRSYDFIPEKSLMGTMFAAMPDGAVGGAPGFLDFLVNHLRPMLAREYCMDLNDQGYAGHSGGGQFGLYGACNKSDARRPGALSAPPSRRGGTEVR